MLCNREKNSGMLAKTEGKQRMGFLMEVFDFVLNLIIDIDIIRSVRSKFFKKKEKAKTDHTDEG